MCDRIFKNIIKQINHFIIMNIYIGNNDMSDALFF